jgi:hypothetical protein
VLSAHPTQFRKDISLAQIVKYEKSLAKDKRITLEKYKQTTLCIIASARRATESD